MYIRTPGSPAPSDSSPLPGTPLATPHSASTESSVDPKTNLVYTFFKYIDNNPSYAPRQGSKMIFRNCVRCDDDRIATTVWNRASRLKTPNIHTDPPSPFFCESCSLDWRSARETTLKDYRFSEELQAKIFVPEKK